MKEKSRGRAPRKIPTVDSQAHELVRQDGLEKLVLGTPSANRKANALRETDKSLEDAYTTSATAARIVDIVGEEAIRVGFTLETDEDYDVVEFRSKWEALNVEQVFQEAYSYARLYGGAAILLRSRTEGDETNPWRETEEVESLRAIAGPELAMAAGSDEYDPDDLGMPLIWDVTPMYGGTAVKVHNSRLLRLTGKQMPLSWRKASNGWQRYFGMSALQGMLEEIGDYDECHRWATMILKRLQQGVWYGDGIGEMCETLAGERSVQRRLALVDAGRSSLSTIAVDKANEDYKLLTGSVAGVEALLKEKKSRMTHAAGIPAIVLLGDTSGGLNGSAEGAMETWNNRLDNVCKLQITPIVQRIVQSLLPKLGDYSVKWNPRSQETPSQQADRLQKQAQADTTYTDGQIITQDELRATLTKRGDYVLGVVKPPPLPDPNKVQIQPGDANPGGEDA